MDLCSGIVVAGLIFLVWWLFFKPKEPTATA
jgi:hypothetical protein